MEGPPYFIIRGDGRPSGTFAADQIVSRKNQMSSL